MVNKINKKSLEHILTVLLGILLVSSIFLTVYLINTPKVGVRFTEFYILNEDYKAYDYPTNPHVNESNILIIGVRNYECKPLNYRVWVFLSNKTYDYNYTLNITPEDRWNGTLSYNTAFTREIFLRHDEIIFIPLNFTIDSIGKHKIVFILSINNSNRVYRSLRLWVNVSEPPKELI